MQSYFLGKIVSSPLQTEEIPAAQGVNLALLCIRLNEAFSQYDLLALCAELRVMPGRFGLDRPHLKLEGLISLIDTFDKNGRFPELLAACNHIRPGIADPFQPPVS